MTQRTGSWCWYSSMTGTLNDEFKYAEISESRTNFETTCLGCGRTVKLMRHPNSSMILMVPRHKVKE